MGRLANLVLILALLHSTAQATPPQMTSRQDSVRPSPYPSPSLSPRSNEVPLSWIIDGWWVVGITVASAFPWAVVAVLDAIDSSYRTRDAIQGRLLLSLICLLLAYITGLMFVSVLLIHIVNNNEPGQERYDEVATVLVLLVFNLWHVGRNIRGWLQYFALLKLDPLFRTVQRKMAESAPLDQRERRGPVFIGGIDRLRISDRLIDNDWNQETPFLNPFYPIRSEVSRNGKQKRGLNMFSRRREEKIRRKSSLSTLSGSVPELNQEAWSVALWRAWWTQDTRVSEQQANDLTVSTLPVDRRHRVRVAENLLSITAGPRWPRNGVVINTSRVCTSTGDENVQEATIKTREEWAEALATYGGAEGQQDSRGDTLPIVANFGDASGVACVVREKTHYPPNRMSALWYNTARFEDLYDVKRVQVLKSGILGRLTLPSWSSWLKIAQDIGTHLSTPIYLSDTHLVNFAGELASASLIITLYSEEYRKLVLQIYNDGLNARFTFGWSGLLSCFSHLWTTERIHVAMLNGLSLLALAKFGRAENIEDNCRAMMYGYASFAVQERAVGKRIAEDRKSELLERYRADKGKTCRGSGVHSTRLACRALGLPQEASHMDGLPAFATGWAGEFLFYKPGNDKPEHGDTHDDVESRHGSSNVWRYPHSHT